MPTGYTAAVADGTITDLSQFVMQLARGMGALVTMRDAPADAPIPEQFEPSNYNAERLRDALAERDRLNALSSGELQDAADLANKEYEAERAKAEQAHAEQRARYQAMFDKVEAWTGAPEGIKEFALQQLRDSMDFDCREPFTFWSKEPANDGASWLEAALAKVEWDIEYHTKQDAEERARVDARNAWLKQLRASLAAAA